MCKWVRRGWKSGWTNLYLSSGSAQVRQMACAEGHVDLSLLPGAVGLAYPLHFTVTFVFINISG